jgi:hypothetical protein
MTNPLIDKYNEIYGKKEEPKKVAYELTPEFFEELKKLSSTNISVTTNCTTPSVATSNTGITKASTIKSYDKHSANDAFLELAEKVKNGTAQVQVSSVYIEVEHYVYGKYGKKITFEVYDYEP